VPGASSRIDGFQDPKFLTNIPHIDKKDEEAKKFRSRTYWQEMKPDHDPTIHQHAQAGSQPERKRHHLRNSIQDRHCIKEKYLQQIQAP
jgi:hypothetical protein